MGENGVNINIQEGRRMGVRVKPSGTKVELCGRNECVQVLFPDKDDVGVGVGYDGSVDFAMSKKTTGTKDYNVLLNRPKINSNLLEGDKDGRQLGLQNLMDEITAQEIDRLIYGG